MRIKSTIFFLFFVSIVFAQKDSILRRKYSISCSKYNVYAFCDVVRCAGLGAEYRPTSFFAADVKIAIVYPHGFMESNISANDYFFNTGAAFMLTPKFYPGGKKIFFVGLNFGFYDYGYKNKWAESGVEYDKYNLNKELRDRQTLAFTLGPTLGFTGNTEKNNVELFLTLGMEATSNNITVYDGYNNGMKITSPYSYHVNGGQINVLAGIKFGFGFNREKYYAKRYYVNTLRKLIYNDDKFVQMNYRSDITFWDRLQEYSFVKDEQYNTIKQVYAKSPKDTVTLNKAVKESQSKIIEYINKHFRNKNFEYKP